MSDRFFSTLPITTDHVTLDGPEAHHLLHVLRAEAGRQITLFDNSGAEFAAEIIACGRTQLELRITQRLEVNRELPFELVVGVSLPKGDRQKWLAEKLAELGVRALVPLRTERGVAEPTAGAIERLTRTATEAAKQCGRNRLMYIAPPQPCREWFAGESPTGARRLFAHPDGPPLCQWRLSAPTTTQLAVGPEGGFTDEETAAAVAAGWQAVGLGPRILRVETAAVALAAVVALSAET